MNPGLQIPDYVESVIQPIRQAGFPVYAVGGCVRDSLLGLQPHDYDLCTGALPDQVAAIFPDHDLVTAGQKHGTTGVVTFQGIVEVTTFRREGTYSDGRHPDSVTFVSGLREDLARRDFTVNAMAWRRIPACRTPSAAGRICKTGSCGLSVIRRPDSGKTVCGFCGASGLPSGLV